MLRHLEPLGCASVQAGTATIHYEVYGQGERVILFVHGAGGNSAVWWRNVPYFVKQGYKVICIDHRFFGTSSAPADGFDAGGMIFAREAIAVLDAEKVEKAALVCQSLGGNTGIHVANSFPSRIHALVMCNTCAGMQLPKDLFERQRALLKEQLDKIGKPDPKKKGAATASLGGLALSQEFQEENPELAFQYGANASFNAWQMETSKGFLGPIQKTTVAAENLRKISCPAMMITSDLDPLQREEILKEAALLIGPKGAEICHFPGHGHSVYFEDPAGFNFRVHDFFKKSLGWGPKE